MLRKLAAVTGSIVMAFLIIRCGANEDTADHAEPPATVHAPVVEAELTTITLTQQAVDRLGIESVPVEMRPVGYARMYGAEVIAVSGRTPVLTAPFTGMAWPAADARFPVAGQKVRKGQPLCRIVQLPPGNDIIGVQELLTLREAELETAESAVRRAEQLVSDEAGSQRNLEEARASLASAAAAANSARARLDLLQGTAVENTVGLTSFIVESPVDGVIQRVYPAQGQIVETAAPVLDIAALDPLWIRVSIYAGDIQQIDTERPAVVQDLGQADNRYEVKPVASPYTADAGTVSADLLYELRNRDLTFRPGQKVSVTVPWKTEAEQRIVPYEAILYDINGGTWVYERSAPTVFIRRRVEIAWIRDGWAVLSRGPAPGTSIARTGVAELYGTEFGIGGH